MNNTTTLTRAPVATHTDTAAAHKRPTSVLKKIVACAFIMAYASIYASIRFIPLNISSLSIMVVLHALVSTMTTARSVLSWVCGADET